MSALPDSRRARKRQQTADRLVEVAFELFAAHGYDNVTMEQIAAAADVAKGTLYNHFPVKEALVCHRFHGDLGKALPELLAEAHRLPSCEAKLRAFFRASAAYSEASREYMGAYVHYRMSRPLDHFGRENRSGLDRFYAVLLAEGQQSGEISTAFPAEKMAGALMFLHLGCLLGWLRDPQASLTKEFDAMLDLFLGGAAPRKQS